MVRMPFAYIFFRPMIAIQGSRKAPEKRESSDLTETLEERCVAAGVKLTGARKTILRVLDEAADHPSVEDVLARARAHNPAISMATVYRTLNMLAESDLVLRHDFKENFARYEVNEAHHDHLIDIETGAVVEFQDEELERLKAAIARRLGFDLVDHTLALYGRKRSAGSEPGT